MNNKDVLEIANDICSDYNVGIFQPLLEADVSGYIYHLIVDKGLVQVRDIHLDSRVIGAGKNQKFDIVIGFTEIRNDSRPAIKSNCVIEVKVFPISFNDQQHRVHFKHVIDDDIPKLASIPCDNKIELLFDERNYLKGTYAGQLRIDVIQQECVKRDTSIDILWLFVGKGGLTAKLI